MIKWDSTQNLWVETMTTSDSTTTVKAVKSYNDTYTFLDTTTTIGGGGTTETKVYTNVTTTSTTDDSGTTTSTAVTMAGATDDQSKWYKY
jgi:hypothetical protein